MIDHIFQNYEIWEWYRTPSLGLNVVSSQIDLSVGHQSITVNHMYLYQLYSRPWRVAERLDLHKMFSWLEKLIPHNVLASDYLTDCHQALFFQQDTRVY